MTLPYFYGIHFSVFYHAAILRNVLPCLGPPPFSGFGLGRLTPMRHRYHTRKRGECQLAGERFWGFGVLFDRFGEGESVADGYHQLGAVMRPSVCLKSCAGHFQCLDQCRV